MAHEDAPRRQPGGTQLAVIARRSGCKVGWVTVDNQAEATKLAKQARKSAERMWDQGYDFGFQSPGQVKDHGDGTYTVTTP